MLFQYGDGWALTIHDDLPLHETLKMLSAVVNLQIQYGHLTLKSLSDALMTSVLTSGHSVMFPVYVCEDQPGVNFCVDLQTLSKLGTAGQYPCHMERDLNSYVGTQVMTFQCGS